MLETYLKLLDQGYFEVGEAFRGLKDENVWRRPAGGLLSVGEIVGHIAYWEAVKFAGEGEDLAKCKIRSPLIDRRFRYRDETITTQPGAQHLSMTSEQVYNELLRVHAEAMSQLRTLNPDLAGHPPGWPPKHTYDLYLAYAVFHIGYHTGQIYSVRHLLGEQTPDN